ncbi:uncharacterized protein LOC122277721 [Carya illinoinensis]|uniref:uncharacterized protein LOC122277721 n=1 Tax=Carya illinoinensis TaxID=32201 RepID=UPI001C71CE41|nr:uncharacterized protein LOC122277721 [Carya illinoinensis]
MKHKGQNPKAHNRDPLPYKTLPSRFSLMSIVMNSWDRNSSSIACTFVDPVSYGNIRGGGWPYTASKGETFVDVCNEAQVLSLQRRHCLIQVCLPSSFSHVAGLKKIKI